ncbi:glycosyltransferase family 4 protein [Nostoc sp. CHAB 5844]|nr:glycosyltransferase family 4 protein [Nostoc sp. CHAB 5844]
MKVAFDYQTFALQSYGGISRYFVKLAKGLDVHGCDTRIFAPLHRNRYLAELDDNKVQGFELNDYPPKTARLFLRLNHSLCSRAISRFAPDVIHETYFSKHPTSSHKLGIRFLTVYDMIHEKFASQFPGRDQTSQNKLLAVQRADHVICISQSTRNDLCDLFDIDSSKVSVVHLGFEGFNALGKRRQLSVSRPYLLYVGQRKGYKNFQTVLRALASLTNIGREIDVVAFGGGAFCQEEVGLINSLGFSDRQVRQMSGGDDLLEALYEKALAFVYPSYYEGFGLPPLEAMAYKCPVISSNTSSMPEVIGDAGLFFDPSSADDLASIIESIFFDSELRNKLIEKGLRRKELFTWHKCSEETAVLYKKYAKNGV